MYKLSKLAQSKNEKQHKNKNEDEKGTKMKIE